MNRLNFTITTILFLFCGCAPTVKEASEIPALDYVKSLSSSTDKTTVANSIFDKKEKRGEISKLEEQPSYDQQLQEVDQEKRAALNPNLSNNNISPFLSGHYPGESVLNPSLWRENASESNLYGDQRAWRPMDLLTIGITEESEGSKEADTNVKSESTFAAAINNLFGIETSVAKKNPDLQGTTSGIALKPLIDTDASSEFKGQGETTRKGKLTAKISAMVAEVLPSGILRVEGKKIIAVNNEEQVMVITGLVRPYDINSNNEVDSAKIANMRIAFFLEI